MNNKKFIHVFVLISLLYAPIGLGAQLTGFTFQSIIELVNGPAPISELDLISGHVNIDSKNKVSEFVEPWFSSFEFQGSLSFGSYAEDPVGHSQGPIFNVTLEVEKDLVPALDDLPPGINPADVPDTVDVLGFEIVEDMGVFGDVHHYESFEMLFIFDGQDNILGGDDNTVTLDDIDFLNIFTKAIYTGFEAERTEGDDENPVWNVYGAARVQYAQSPVPVPAAIWLFGSGLLGLMGLRKVKAS